eukprot:5181288-Amphidinium_carterae.1
MPKASANKRTIHAHSSICCGDLGPQGFCSDHGGLGKASTCGEKSEAHTLELSYAHVGSSNYMQMRGNLLPKC